MLGGGKGVAAVERAVKPIETILLAEDNEINREIMQSQLKAMGYSVDTAANGAEALKLYQQKAYDVILTDIEMPEKNGYELTAEIRRLETDASRSIPIFAITASEFDLNEERAVAMGFTGYMLKPLEIEVLKKKLAAIGCGD